MFAYIACDRLYSVYAGLCMLSVILCPVILTRMLGIICDALNLYVYYEYSHHSPYVIDHTSYTVVLQCALGSKFSYVILRRDNSSDFMQYSLMNRITIQFN